MLMQLILIVTLIITITRLVLAIQLTVTARRKEMRNLFWLAVYFYATFFADVFLATNSSINAGTSVAINIGSKTLYIFILLTSLAYLVGDMAMISFIQLTFYRDRKSPRLFFVGTALVFFAIGIVIAFTTGIMAPFNPFIWAWLAFVAYKGYQQFANKPVEDWIKARYQLVLIYAIVLFLAALSTIPSAMGNLTTSFLAIVASIPAVLLQYLVWAMPKQFRAFLNRNYVAVSEE